MPESRAHLGDVVVVIPGILGSVLQRNGKDVWGLSGGAIMRGLLTAGESIKELALTSDPLDVDFLDDGIRATRLVEDVHLIPGLWKIDGYTRITEMLTRRFTLDLGRNLFHFPYDWRRDIRVAARLLGRACEEWLTRWREASGNPKAMVTLIGHSQGGLVARYYVEALGGWEQTRRLITIGTPHGGSLNPLNFISNGHRPGYGPLSIDLNHLVRSLTSLYQMLPTFPCVDSGGEDLELVTDASIPNVDPGRAKAGREFHQEIQHHAEKNKENPEYVNHGLRVTPVVGMYQPTYVKARLESDSLELLKATTWTEGGDGTVPRRSAGPSVLGAPATMYAAERHSQLHNWPPTLVQLAGWLSELPEPPAVRMLLGPSLQAHLGLDVEDAYLEGEAIKFTVYTQDPDSELKGQVKARPALGMTLESPHNEREVKLPQGEIRTAEFPPLPPGLYDLMIQGEDQTTDSIHDVFVVAALGQIGR